MSYLWLAIAVVSFAGSGPAPSPSHTLTPIHVPKACWDVAKTSIDMMECADNDAREADAEMNRLYQQLLKTAPSPTDRKNLVAAQTAWLAFRKADVIAKHPTDTSQADGFLFAKCGDGEYERLTVERIKEFQSLLNPPLDACHIPWVRVH